MLPLLLVIVVGLIDFGSAFNLKQKLTNGGREGARIAIGQSTADLTLAAPSTVQAVRNAVVNYLQSENIDTSIISSGPTKTGPMEWTYSSTATGDAILIIDRGFVVNGPTGLIVSTRVRLNYPFQWSFSRIIQLLVPSASYSSSFLISTEVVMKNLI
jgi:Flp pilus assembly protein TadG